MDPQAAVPPLPELTFQECLHLMEALVEDLPEQALVAQPFSIGITTTTGRRMTIDSTSRPIVSERSNVDVGLSIITNERTLSAVLTGELDPKRPNPDHLFVCGGDLRQWTALVASVSEGAAR